VLEQVLPMGPVASQVAIKQLGTNGGGFFNVNSAHPFENPTPLTNFLEMLAILLIPAALCYTFGMMIKDKRQGWAILVAMFLLFIPAMGLTVYFEQQGNVAFPALGVDQTAQNNASSGGNMEGKETRFGVINSALWAAATTATANGSVNAMHDSFTALGGLVPLWMMYIGEIIFGGVGSGLYGMILFVFITVFVTGLMAGRSPVYLGKKIEPFELKMAAIAVLVVPLLALLLTALSVVSPTAVAATGNPGAHGFTEILYAFTSMTNNNGSAFAGLNAANAYYDVLGGIVMLFGRYWIAIPVLALAGSFARKKILPNPNSVLPTYTLFFILLLMGVVFILGAPSFLPALALGPIAEELTLWGQYAN
jgi:K+-transporting ATPase ATPase A chain